MEGVVQPTAIYKGIGYIVSLVVVNELIPKRVDELDVSFGICWYEIRCVRKTHHYFWSPMSDVFPMSKCFNVNTLPWHG